MSSGDETVFVRVRVLRAGDASLFVEAPTGEGFGVPLSQLRDDPRVDDVVEDEDDEGIICIPRWLAEDRGLV